MVVVAGVFWSFEVEGRRVALWMASRGVTDLDCLPKVRGK